MVEIRTNFSSGQFIRQADSILIPTEPFVVETEHI